MLVYWVHEGSVSLLASEKVTGDTSMRAESQVKLGRTFHSVKIAAFGRCACICDIDIVEYGRGRSMDEVL